MKKIIQNVLIFLIIAGCASPKPTLYSGGNYTDKKIDENLYTVSFSGSDQNNVLKMMMIRCSEMTIKQGFKYFIVLNNQNTVRKTKLNFILTISETYYTTSIIKMVNAPVSGKVAYDADAIFRGHKKTIGLVETDSEQEKRIWSEDLNLN